MIPVFIHADPMKIATLKLHLELHGISCFIRNEHLSSLTGGSFGPFVFRLRIFDPVLCVVDQGDEIQARQLLKEYMKSDLLDNWLCPQCQEAVPTSFDFCWNCSSDPAVAEIKNQESKL